MVFYLAMPAIMINVTVSAELRVARSFRGLREFVFFVLCFTVM